MAASYSIEIEAGITKQFSDLPQLISWLERERTVSTWLWSGNKENATVDPQHFQQLANNLQQGIQLATNGDDPRLQQWIHNVFSGVQKQIIPSESEIGQKIQKAKDQFGEGVARALARILWQGVDANLIKTPSDIKAMLLSVDEAWGDRLAISEDLKAERRSLRALFTRLENERQASDQEASRRDSRRIRKVRKAIALLRAGAERKSEEVLRNLAERSETSIAAITETNDFFTKQMGLRAPVRYWKTKARVHRMAERRYAFRALVFFPSAAAILIIGAWIAGTVILSVDEIENRAPTYFLTAGALLALTTLMFWIGRLIIKLWLSEHHLRKDALERAVMTETFLAMDKEVASLDTERAIVLTAIFRPTPDGVVRDEGPGDIGIQAAISKYLSKN